MSDIATLIGKYTAAKTQADALYAEAKDLEAEIIFALKDEYPEDYGRWQRGISSFTAEGVTIPVSRSYDVDAVKAEFGEERPDLVETVTTEKVNGRALSKLWHDAAYAKRLEKTLKPPVPRLKLK